MMITKICLTCGKEFKVPHWRKDTAKYCCPDCRQQSFKGELNCTCEVCGKKFHLKPYQLNKYKHHCCSKKCLNVLKQTLYKGEGNHQYGLKGPLNASFKGNEITKKNNTLTEIVIYDPTHPRCDECGRVTKHRYLVEENYTKFDPKYFEEVNGRTILKKGVQVHHINGDHNDNRIENLMPVTKSEHRVIHNLGITIVRDEKTGKITGVLKQGELLGSPEVGNQQPSLDSNIFEGSETSSRVQMDSNAATSALHSNKNEDIVRPADITNETAELQNKESVR